MKHLYSIIPLSLALLVSTQCKPNNSNTNLGSKSQTSPKTQGTQKTDQTRDTSLDHLYSPIKPLEISRVHTTNNTTYTSDDNTGGALTATLEKGSTAVTFSPNQKFWDISAYSYLRIEFTNNSDAIVWVKGRLENPGAKDWQNSSSSGAYARPGERVILGFPYSRKRENNDAGSMYNLLSGKPNGHRTHWKEFDPQKVQSLRLTFHSKAKQLQIDNITLDLAHTYGVDANKERLKLPYLDQFGQVKADHWNGKLSDQDELLSRAKHEAQLPLSPPTSFNQYGGWAAGPTLKKTGFFYTTKHNGKWWFVDPNGKLFFSQGLNTVGFHASTPYNKKLAPLFSDLPPKESEAHNALSAYTKKHGTKLSYIRYNLYQTFGEDWKAKACDRIHKRLKHWGINTIGAWSDQHLIHDSSQKTPYTGQVHVSREWQYRLTDDTPDPYVDKFPLHVANAIQTVAKDSATDPWCIGIFVDNETDWPGNLVEIVMSRDIKQPAKKKFLTILKTKYHSIEKLNTSWKTSFASWEELHQPQKLANTPDRMSDYKALYNDLANTYFKVIRESVNRLMPNHLFLGSRIHSCPVEVAQACAKYTDVYSLNHYVHQANTGNLPVNADKPVLISEFHFAAPDRGIPGVGLSPVGNQRQRARSYAGYVVAGLTNPNIIGVHWFTYADQMATGRPYENYQIGFVDVTDTPYPILTKQARTIADSMYEVRSKTQDVLDGLEKTWQTKQ